METIMQVLSETRFYWLPVALAVVSVALGCVVGSILREARKDLGLKIDD